MWDDELERLTNYVTDMFGEDAFNAAVTRAVGAVKAAEARNSAGIMGASSDPDGSSTESELVYEALRAELRQLARPQ